MGPSEILNAAADRLASKGWIQGSYVPIEQSMYLTHEIDIGPSDLTGAIRLVAGGAWNKDSLAAKSEAKELVREVIGGGSLGEWNDEDARTMEEVIGVLRLAAERCK